jgi:hypothetical protein
MQLGEWDAKTERSRRRWSEFRSDYVWLLSHLLPNEKCDIIHVKKTHLIAVLTSLTVDTNRRQEFRLIGIVSDHRIFRRSGCYPPILNSRMISGSPTPPRYAEAIENTLLQQEYEKEVPSVNSRESSCSSSEWRDIFAVAISLFANSGISNSSTVYSFSSHRSSAWR